MKLNSCFFALLLLFSCSTNHQIEKPNDLIPKDTMVALLLDMTLVASSKNNKNKNKQSKVNYMPLIFEKYAIDSLRFYHSNNYYTSVIPENELLYKDVQKRLKALETIYVNKKKIMDSIQKDSMLNKKNLLKEDLNKKKRIDTSTKRKPTSLKKKN